MWAGATASAAATADASAHGQGDGVLNVDRKSPPSLSLRKGQARQAILGRRVLCVGRREGQKGRRVTRATETQGRRSPADPRHPQAVHSVLRGAVALQQGTAVSCWSWEHRFGVRYKIGLSAVWRLPHRFLLLQPLPPRLHRNF